MKKNINWGIVGLGKIAHKFAKDLSLIDGATLYAVASRNIDNAASFSAEHGSKKHYGSYSDLFKDSEVDIVYIATTNNTHAELTIEALNYKVAVLCEKPFAINGLQVAEMIRASKQNNTFLMEAMWSRFIPVILDVKKRIDAGEIGDIKYLQADFCFNAPDTIQRVHDIVLGGGSLLDIGIYPVFLAYLIIGTPENINAHAEYFDSGTDAQLAMQFIYSDAHANLFSSFNSYSKRDAKISGTKGEIIIDAPWNESDSYSISDGANTETISKPTLGRGYTYEIMECNDCLRNGLKEHPVWSLKESQNLIDLLDRIRKIVDVRYAEDKD